MTVFAVNKATRAEIQRLFNKLNRLILIKLLHPQLKELIHHAGIPIISDDERLKNCSTHVAYIEVDWTTCMKRDAKGNFDTPPYAIR